MAAICPKCNTVPTVRRVQTKVLGTKPVDLALCECDYVPCAKCKRSTRGLPAGAQHCPGCRARL